MGFIQLAIGFSVFITFFPGSLLLYGAAVLGEKDNWCIKTLILCYVVAIVLAGIISVT